MNPNRIPWKTFFFLSLISIIIWLKFSYPQLAITNHSITRSQAIEIAKDNLQKRGNVDIEAFQIAVIFKIDERTNRYLQKTVGFNGLKTFIAKHDFDLFFWKVRFFAENVKEEFLFTINSATGEITGFTHIIDDNAARQTIKKDEARANTQTFLSKKFGFNPSDYTLRSNFATVRDNRSDFLFSWQKRNVNIPWSREPDSGTGKLITKAQISGNEILSFSKNIFIVPDQFKRYLENQRDLSHTIMIGVKIIVLILLASGIFLIIIRQNHLAMQTTKNFYIGIMLFSFVLSLLAIINQYHHVLFSYQTTISLSAYLWRYGINAIISALLITVAILIPSLAGELVHYETSHKQKGGSFLYYIRSTFASREIAGKILLGYCVGIIMLGIQSFLIKIGQTHLGVWIEHGWINNSSTAYYPFLAAFTFGFKASLSEEIMYRLYAINLGKKIFNKMCPEGKTGNLLVIALITSLIWGFAHSSHFIFPIWFRGLEVTCLGIFLAFIYLRFGFIPVLVGHYLVDVFWSSAGYIFGVSKPFDFYSSLLILLLPLMLGIIAFFLNRKEDIKPLRWHLNKHQRYNLEILKAFLNANKKNYQYKSHKEIKDEMTSHGWDPAVVDIAMKDFQNDKN